MVVMVRLTILHGYIEQSQQQFNVSELRKTELQATGITCKLHRKAQDPDATVPQSHQAFHKNMMEL